MCLCSDKLTGCVFENNSGGTCDDKDGTHVVLACLLFYLSFFTILEVVRPLCVCVVVNVHPSAALVCRTHGVVFCVQKDSSVRMPSPVVVFVVYCLWWCACSVHNEGYLLGRRVRRQLCNV